MHQCVYPDTSHGRAEMSRRRALAAFGGLAAIAAGCDTASETRSTPEPGGASVTGVPVVVYTALDKEFSQPVLKIYAKKNGAEVRPVFDVESTKSFGLAGRIIAEAETPSCDLFWNNEILNTIRLKQRNLLEAFEPKGGKNIPAAFRDPAGMWYGFAARARILLINTKLVGESERPTSLRDMLDPKWQGKIGIAKPLFGTTGTHAAALFAMWGDEKAKAFFNELKDNGVVVLSGNRQVAADVAAGRLAFGLTDTDDALLEVNAQSPVAISYPDRNPDQGGTLFIPNTVARVRGCRHTEAADALASYLISPDVEQALALGPSGQIPLNPSVDVKLQVESPKTVTPMRVDFDQAAALWESTVAPFLTTTFGG